MKQTTAERLNTLINSKLPKVTETGIVNHLMPKTFIETKSKGKAIVFTWKRNFFRISDKHAVREQNFMNEWVETEESKQIQALVRT
jgi:hypothetical protein